MDKLRAAGEAQATAAQHLAEAGRLQAASTDSLANNSARQLGAIQASADAAKAQAGAVQKQADATIVASNATDRLASAGQAQSVAVLHSLDTAKAANQIALNASLVADRPWLGADVPGNIVPQANQDYVATFNIANTGRSPAINAGASILIDIYKYDVALDRLPECTGGCQTYTVFPNGGFAFHPQIAADRMTPDQIKRIDDRTEAIILRIRFDYFDSNGRPHTTWNCSYYAPKLGFTSCRGSAGAN